MGVGDIGKRRRNCVCAGPGTASVHFKKSLRVNGQRKRPEHRN